MAKTIRFNNEELEILKSNYQQELEDVLIYADQIREILKKLEPQPEQAAKTVTRNAGRKAAAKKGRKPKKDVQQAVEKKRGRKPKPTGVVPEPVKPEFIKEPAKTENKPIKKQAPKKGGAAKKKATGRSAKKAASAKKATTKPGAPGADGIAQVETTKV
jgi:Asp-tRNA(Asn)/Glu-tRNA(Gln) amidotransferase C subunit